MPPGDRRIKTLYGIIVPGNGIKCRLFFDV